MDWSRKFRLSGMLALMLLVPGAVGSQAPASDEPSRLEVDNLIFKGVNSVSEKELRLNLYTDESHCTSLVLYPLCRLTHAHYVYTRKYLNREELKRDVLRAKVFYWKRGFRETGVDTLVARKGEDDAIVTFLIDEGKPTVVTDITVTQSKPVLGQRAIDSRLLIKKQQPLNLIKLDSTLVFLAQGLWNQGYADAIVDTTVVIDPDARTATVGIDLNPRWKATVSDIIVEGNEKVETSTILKSLTLRPGSLFKRSELLRSQRALYESNLFKRAAIEIPRQSDSSKVIIVNVTEAPLRESRLSFGFNTVDFFQTEGRFTNYNFFGRARRLDIQAGLGNLFARSLNSRFIFRDAFSGVIDQRSRYFAPTYNASVSFREPWFGSQGNELGASVFGHRRTAPGIYIDKGFGSSVAFTREVVERVTATADYRFELNRVDAGDVYFCINFGVCDQPTLGALRQRHRLSPLTLTTTINRANKPLSPTRGYRATADFETASAFTLSDFRYNRASADAAVYRPFRSNGSIAGHLRLGWVDALESTVSAIGLNTGDAAILHPRKRFYAGGSRSVRGFGENQLGPRVLTIPSSKLRGGDPACTADVNITLCNPNAAGISRADFEARPLGGNFVAETSVEFRVPLIGQLVGAVFVDAGYVSQKTNPTLPGSKTAITPGFGVRYLSPVGPIRVDFGINPGLSDELPVVTEAIVDGKTKLVTLTSLRRFNVVRGGVGGILDRLTLHLSIGEAF
ncbi:MAG: BamA/TamA family outer membrane protein [Gemmatimonadaceae bacterium]